MTISSTTSKSGPYNGNGSTTVFAYDFKILANTEIEVVLTSTAGVETVKTLTTHYTVSGVGSASGNVTMITAPATGEKLTLRRKLSGKQELDLQNQGAYYAEDVETAIDRLTMYDLQQQEELDRCIKVPVSDTTDLASLTADLVALSGATSDIATVAGISGNVTTVAGISANVTTVAGVSADVTTVAGVSASVTTCASNIAAINAAPTEASAAAASASSASTSASTATTQAGIATTQAGLAAASALAADASADAAALSEAAAAASAAALPNAASIGNGKVPLSNGTTWSGLTPSTGTVTQIIAGTGLTGGTITTSGTIAVDVGTTANKIVQLDGLGYLPALNGSALTSLNGSNIASGTVPPARMGSGTPSSSNYLRGDGVWASGSSKIAQVVKYQTGTYATGTTIIPDDNTVPQNTEGDQYMSLAITPTNALSILIIDVIGFASHTASHRLACALFQDSAANALAATSAQIDSVSTPVHLLLRHTMTAGTTSLTTFKVRVGSGGAGTCYFNGDYATQLYGGVAASSITIWEVLP